MKDIYILDGARTPMAEYNGHFSDTSAIELAVIASKEATGRPKDLRRTCPPRAPRSAHPGGAPSPPG